MSTFRWTLLKREACKHYTDLLQCRQGFFFRTWHNIKLPLKGCKQKLAKAKLTVSKLTSSTVALSGLEFIARINAELGIWHRRGLCSLYKLLEVVPSSGPVRVMFYSLDQPHMMRSVCSCSAHILAPPPPRAGGIWGIFTWIVDCVADCVSTHKITLNEPLTLTPTCN